jgi:hypothetical protein
VLSPNTQPVGGQDSARATAHGAFDDDPATLKATLARILGATGVTQSFSHHRSEQSNRAVRQALLPATNLPVRA